MSCRVKVDIAPIWVIRMKSISYCSVIYERHAQKKLSMKMVRWAYLEDLIWIWKKQLSLFFKEHSTRFLTICRFIAFALMVLKFLVFKVCVITGISKIGFFNFSDTERVKYALNKKRKKASLLLVLECSLISLLKKICRIVSK